MCRSFNTKDNIEGQFLNRIIWLHKSVEFWRTQLPTFMAWSEFIARSCVGVTERSIV